MDRNLCLSSVVLAACVTLTTPVSGFWWGDNCAGCVGSCGAAPTPRPAQTAFDYCHDIYNINRPWPSPYVCPDRVTAHSPFNAMVSNGWRRQNLMAEHHFKTDSSELTQAGELKIQWIMTQAPPAYRRMFVERSIDPEVTKTRIDTITKYAELIAQDGEAPRVAETHIVSEGRPASTVDFVNTQFRQNMRVPTLPVSTGENE
ncbi:hypothetical protein Pla123a_22690 [Posidoniimonas polymericola]|uniref:Uncharacterized protein n=1 Tax=Posidoniimonas polymericola TaxID=2528002 RepID=A0A5C5YPL8_9BACT|nr:hypothetical protein [Posidoniimonas polymericola]TWT76846.1 hypothetical protein Pla123a_22690 [Posidoniimonas polymericola]